MRILSYLRSPLIWGSLLILGGVFLLIQNLTGWQVGSLFWAGLMATIGMVFLSLYFDSARPWWPLIPGVILLALALGVVLDVVAPQLSALDGPIILGGIALSFILVYWVERENWWAIIPAGVLLTLALISFLEYNNFQLVETGALFFAGLGLTFLAVGLLPTPAGPMRWAFIPASVLLLIGVLIAAALTNFLVYLGPLALMVGGAYMVLRAIRRNS